ncbi:MAG TPA: gamma-glutamyl-gamma-aminobutyrate hydrolase family protein [Vicinamibacteria bacterium]|nr:gamma-glutamyl-gamma-aminobutyrate hydrolase family protein [Vicinamibacteria bacterium]
MGRAAVGLTIGNSDDPEIFHLRDDYVRSIEKAGGLPLVFAPGRAEDARELLDRVDALVLSGGADVDPALYGEARHATVERVFPERDAFEIALAREALRRDLPLLAICRGHQVLNVATGGTLVQDIPSQLPGARDHDPDTERWECCHEVEILPGTRLREVVGTDRVAVNSFHHQPVKDLGEGLVLSARGEDGVVEGIEVPGRRYAIGVQWHPESFWDRPRTFQPLFEGLVKAAR